MKKNFVAKVSLFIFAIFSAQNLMQGFAGEQVWAKTPVDAIPVLTTFHCIPMGDAFATVAKRGGKQTPPMIVWRSTLGEYGQYTPQRRCEIVSDKFTRAVALNGGKLSGMLLTYGVNNRQRVICYVNTLRGACNSDNQLFTLRPADRDRERQILEQLVNFSIKGAGTPVQQSGELFYADLGNSIEQFFSTADVIPTTPSSTPLSNPKTLVSPSKIDSSI